MNKKIIIMALLVMAALTACNTSPSPGLEAFGVGTGGTTNKTQGLMTLTVIDDTDPELDCLLEQDGTEIWTGVIPNNSAVDVPVRLAYTSLAQVFELRCTDNFNNAGTSGYFTVYYNDGQAPEPSIIGFQ